MVVVDNKCDCSSAPPVTMDPIEIMYILYLWNSRCLTCGNLSWKHFHFSTMLVRSKDYWQYVISHVAVIDVKCVKSFTHLRFQFIWNIRLNLSYLFPWHLCTQWVTKMWQIEVSEGQKEAWIMSPFPPWGKTMCVCLHLQLHSEDCWHCSTKTGDSVIIDQAVKRYNM